MGFLGSTGFLQRHQCQNDIWLTDGDPRDPAEGDAHLIFQAINPGVGLIYVELWVNNGWVAWPLLPGMRATFGEEPAVELAPVQIPHILIVNPQRAQNVNGFLIIWHICLVMKLHRNNNERFYYIPHAPRQGLQTYQTAEQGAPLTQAYRRIKWRKQISHSRFGGEFDDNMGC